MLTDLDETWLEATFGQAAQMYFVGFWFGQQGAEVLSSKGEKMGILAILKDFKAI